MRDRWHILGWWWAASMTGWQDLRSRHCRHRSTSSYRDQYRASRRSSATLASITACQKSDVHPCHIWTDPIRLIVCKGKRTLGKIWRHRLDQSCLLGKCFYMQDSLSILLAFLSPNHVYGPVAVCMNQLNAVLIWRWTLCTQCHESFPGYVSIFSGGKLVVTRGVTFWWEIVQKTESYYAHGPWCVWPILLLNKATGNRGSDKDHWICVMYVVCMFSIMGG